MTSRSEWQEIPGRVFLDTCVVNLILDYGEQIHDSLAIPRDVSARVASDVEALRALFMVGQRASWQLAISPCTYKEVTETRHAERRRELERWFFEVWQYWQVFLESSPDIPNLADAEEIRLRLSASGALASLPDDNDRNLVCDAVVYRCDAFCTRDWRTILKFRQELASLPCRIVTPTEWWSAVRPWSGLWL